MIAVSVGDKHIVNGAEVDSQSLCVTYKHAAGSRVEQDAVTLRLQEYRQPMLCQQNWVVRTIIHQYRPPHNI